MAPDPHLFAIRDAAFDAACPVRRPNESGFADIIPDFVVNLRPARPAHLDARAYLDGLHCGHAHERLRQPPVNLSIPGRVRAEPRHDVARDDLKDSSERVPGLFRSIY